MGSCSSKCNSRSVAENHMKNSSNSDREIGANICNRQEVWSIPGKSSIGINKITNKTPQEDYSQIDSSPQEMNKADIQLNIGKELEAISYDILNMDARSINYVNQGINYKVPVLGSPIASSIIQRRSRFDIWKSSGSTAGDTPVIKINTASLHKGLDFGSYLNRHAGK